MKAAAAAQRRLVIQDDKLSRLLIIFHGLDPFDGGEGFFRSSNLCFFYLKHHFGCFFIVRKARIRPEKEGDY